MQDFQADGVVHLELRTTPRAIPENGITKDDYVKVVLGILNAWNKNAATSMRAYLILSVDRRNSIAQAEEVVDLCIKYQSAGVVGIDLCGDPAKGDVRVFTGPFARAKAAGMKMTLHFAEAKASASDAELETLLSWKPDRLGHVIHVKEEYCRIIERENIGVELCLSCNVHARMITGTYSDHHFGMWRHTNVPVALSVRRSSRGIKTHITDFARLMMWGFFAVLSPQNTPWQRNTLILPVGILRLFAFELSIRSSLAKTRSNDSGHSTRNGMAGQLSTCSLITHTQCLHLHTAASEMGYLRTVHKHYLPCIAPGAFFFFC